MKTLYIFAFLCIANLCTAQHFDFISSDTSALLSQISKNNNEQSEFEQKMMNEKTECMLLIKHQNLNSGIDDDKKLKAAGYLLKLGGSQVMAAGIISTSSYVVGAVMLFAGGLIQIDSSLSGNGTSIGGFMIGLTGILITGGGVVTGSIFRISGSNNIKKAGKILAGEPIF
ncbi:MAG: hypothetical protein EAZ53_05480 [Bacteroidetes bacterium]|nr:MAG: hypothetical protein EAZ53_05480 [Bacteroidota bacterium]